MIDYSLYLCTNSEINNKYPIEECVRQAIIGGVTFVQVREKNKCFEKFKSIAIKIKKITDLYKIPLVINDNIEIATSIDADGIHIGQDDISCKEARNILGPNKIIGVSVTNLIEAKQAIKDGATYLGVGAMYKSKTKKDAKIVDISELKKILYYSNIPVVVIGGINFETIHNFKKLNVAGFAMIRPILDNENITEATKKIKNKILLNNKYIN